MDVDVVLGVFREGGEGGMGVVEGGCEWTGWG